MKARFSSSSFINFSNEFLEEKKWKQCVIESPSNKLIKKTESHWIDDPTTTTTLIEYNKQTSIDLEHDDDDDDQCKIYSINQNICVFVCVWMSCIIYGFHHQTIVRVNWVFCWRFFLLLKQNKKCLKIKNIIIVYKLRLASNNFDKCPWWSS